MQLTLKAGMQIIVASLDLQLSCLKMLLVLWLQYLSQLHVVCSYTKTLGLKRWHVILYTGELDHSTTGHWRWMILPFTNPAAPALHAWTAFCLGTQSPLKFTVSRTTPTQLWVVNNLASWYVQSVVCGKPNRSAVMYTHTLLSYRYLLFYTWHHSHVGGQAF